MSDDREPWPSVDEEEAELERAKARTATSLRPVDSDPNRGRRRIPLTFFPASDLLGLNDEPVDSGGRRRDTTNEGATP